MCLQVTQQMDVSEHWSVNPSGQSSSYLCMILMSLAYLEDVIPLLALLHTHVCLPLLPAAKAQEDVSRHHCVVHSLPSICSECLPAIYWDIWPLAKETWLTIAAQRLHP
jgi:hypothetical protein